MTKVVRVVEDLVELDEIFDENKRKENKPVIIEFTSSVCDPCQFIGPVYTEFAEKYGKSLLFLKVGYFRFSPDCFRFKSGCCSFRLTSMKRLMYAMNTKFKELLLSKFSSAADVLKL